MGSTWRAAADPTVSFDYNVTPHMVGNLADLEFDGQTAITQRGLKGPKRGGESCNYVGNGALMTGAPENDPAAYAPYAGDKRQFLGLAGWAAPDGPRDELRAVGAALAPGSGQPRENDYLETAVIADLPFPPDPRRPNCNSGSVLVKGSCANLHAGSSLDEQLTGTNMGDRILGLGGDDRISAGPGDDCVNGGPGSDRLRCGSGDDVAILGRGDRADASCERIRRAS
jgi:hypothetical protein